MVQQSVVSREYKIMLRRLRFAGDEKKLLKAAAAVWRDFSSMAAAIVLKTEGQLSQIKNTPPDHLSRHPRTALEHSRLHPTPAA